MAVMTAATQAAARTVRDKDNLECEFMTELMNSLKHPTGRKLGATTSISTHDGWKSFVRSAAVGSRWDRLDNAPTPSHRIFLDLRLHRAEEKGAACRRRESGVEFGC